MSIFNCCTGGQPPRDDGTHCGGGAWQAVRTLGDFIGSLVILAILIALFIGRLRDPAGFVMPVVPWLGAGGPWLALAVVVLVPLGLFILYRIFMWWLRRMLCPVFCPMAAALRQAAKFIDDIVAQIDQVRTGIESFGTQMRTALDKLGNVAIPDIPTMAKPLSDAAALLPNIGSLVPKIIDNSAIHANRQIDQLYGSFTTDVTGFMNHLAALSAPLGMVGAGLSSVGAFIGQAAAALESFCCCCESGREEKAPYVKD
jgi:hypothetical protein